MKTFTIITNILFSFIFSTVLFGFVLNEFNIALWEGYSRVATIMHSFVLALILLHKKPGLFNPFRFLIISIVPFLFLYAIFSFAMWEFNVALWHQGFRYVVALIGIIGTDVLYLLLLNYKISTLWKSN